MQALPLVLYLSFFSLCFADLGPHQPRNLTWQVISGAGDTIWSLSKVTTPSTWWPDLFPDVCKLAIGAPPGWDLKGYSDIQRAPSTPPPYVEKHPRDPWGGCSNQRDRSMLRIHPFYVCPGPHRSQSLNPKCGGKTDFFCKSWGCETSGEVYWKPSSNWDYIKVTANYSLESYVPGGFDLDECTDWCHPLRVTFTEPGKRALEWTKGYTWGLRLYKERYDEGLLFTIRLKIETPYSPLGPNKVLAPDEINPRPTPPSSSRPTPPPDSHGTVAPSKRITETVSL